MGTRVECKSRERNCARTRRTRTGGCRRHCPNCHTRGNLKGHAAGRSSVGRSLLILHVIPSASEAGSQVREWEAEMDEIVPDAQDTERLLDLVGGGDREAFDRLFARHRSYLRRVVASRLHGQLRGRVDPSDVVQEAQMEAFRRLPDYLARRPMAFRLWLRKTAQERLLMAERFHLGAARRAVGREVPLPGGESDRPAGELAAGVPTPGQLLETR